MPARCIHENCNKCCIYNREGETKPLYCKNHKLENMINVITKKCIFENCNKCCIYNYEGETRPLYCINHKLENMIDIANRRCNVENCLKNASYNFKNVKKAKYCYEHKLENMVNVSQTLCSDVLCARTAKYNFEDNKKGMYCYKHKLDGMIYVTKKNYPKCENQNCKKIPSYNYDGKKSGMYCSEHKLPNMIDVIGLRCKFQDCTKYAIYKHIDSKSGEFCNEHKTEGMVSVFPTCFHDDCKKQPLYNYNTSKKPLYCTIHKLDYMTNVRDKRCKNEWCDTFVSKKYDGYCMYCFMHLFPDKPIARNYKTKEKAVVDYIKEQFVDIDVVSDKTIENGCSKRRPDILIDIGYHVIIVEIDENQHIGYDCSCENKRIMEVSQDLGHRPIIFIRFNPDDYKNKQEKISSCWNINKQGLCCIKKAKQNEWQQRLEKLKTEMLFWLDPENITHRTIEIVHLYYDT